MAVVVTIAWSGCADDGGARHDARPRPDAAPRADGAPGVYCDGNECAPGSEACCSQVVLPPNGRATFCVEADAAPCDDLLLRCDGPEDCDGGVCCSTLEGVVCVPTADDCNGNRVCHTARDCPGVPCCDSPLPLFRTCRLTCG